MIVQLYGGPAQGRRTEVQDGNWTVYVPIPPKLKLIEESESLTVSLTVARYRRRPERWRPLPGDVVRFWFDGYETY